MRTSLPVACTQPSSCSFSTPSSDSIARLLVPKARFGFVPERPSPTVTLCTDATRRDATHASESLCGFKPYRLNI
eukprot:350303-Amphidinium_carterae.1